MGHYCHFCSEKLFGGIVPTCCDNIECICDACYESVMSNRMSADLSKYILKNVKVEDGKATFPVNEDFLEWLEGTIPKCPECNADWNKTKFVDY